MNNDRATVRQNGKLIELEKKTNGARDWKLQSTQSLNRRNELTFPPIRLNASEMQCIRMAQWLHAFIRRLIEPMGAGNGFMEETPLERCICEWLWPQAHKKIQREETKNTSTTSISGYDCYSKRLHRTKRNRNNPPNRFSQHGRLRFGVFSPFVRVRSYFPSTRIHFCALDANACTLFIRFMNQSANPAAVLDRYPQTARSFVWKTRLAPMIP